MSHRQNLKLLRSRGELAKGPVQRRCTDRSFELPTGMYGAYFGLLFAYLGVMAVGFPHPEMVLPMAIFVIFLTGVIVVPGMWVRMKPDHASKAMRMKEFLERGIVTPTGRSGPGGAMVQVLILPVLILLWGVAAVTIARLS